MGRAMETNDAELELLFREAWRLMHDPVVVEQQGRYLDATIAQSLENYQRMVEEARKSVRSSENMGETH